MKKRLLSLIVITTAFTLTLTANSAFAGGRHHEYWKGIAIGVGAAILGSAILNHNNYTPPRDYENCYVPAPVHVKKYSNRRGHWEVRDEWVPPTDRKVWNPGHYNRRGDWIRGAWIQIVDNPGYWREDRVWVKANVSKHRGY